MPNVILYAATSVNGLISDANGNTPWCDAEWDQYKNVVSRAGCLIVGRRTHETMEQEGSYAKIGVKRVIVLTTSYITLQDGFKAANTPAEALDILEKESFDEVVVGGGAQTNAAFLKENWVDEIYLDIEPRFFGGGLLLCSLPVQTNYKMKLLDINNYAENAVGLRYAIEKG
jgi:dihydrofolate reductase